VTWGVARCGISESGGLVGCLGGGASGVEFGVWRVPWCVVGGGGPTGFLRWSLPSSVRAVQTGSGLVVAAVSVRCGLVSASTAGAVVADFGSARELARLGWRSRGAHAPGRRLRGVIGRMSRPAATATPRCTCVDLCVGVQEDGARRRLGCGAGRRRPLERSFRERAATACGAQRRSDECMGAGLVLEA
jgi:hypothetical protein